MKYGDVLPTGFHIPSHAFWLRGDLEKNPFKYVALSAHDAVMDCGSFIGTFAAAVMEQGASSVTCYEAMPRNCEILRENMKTYGERAIISGTALTAGIDDYVELTTSGFSGANSIVPSPNRPKSVRVLATNFRYELSQIQPDVLKLDVEGAEYDLLTSLKPGDLAKITSLFVEFHPTNEREAKVSIIRKFIESEGLIVVCDRLRTFTANR